MHLRRSPRRGDTPARSGGSEHKGTTSPLRPPWPPLAQAGPQYLLQTLEPRFNLATVLCRSLSSSSLSAMLIMVVVIDEVVGGGDGAGNRDVISNARGKDAGHDNDVFGLVRLRLSIRVHALAPTLSQRDVLLANVVANGRRRPLCCGNLALPLAALPLAALLVTAVW